MATVKNRLEQLEKSVIPRRRNCDPEDLSSEELSFEILESITGGLEEVRNSERWAYMRESAKEAYATRHRGLPDKLAADDPRLTDPLEIFISDLMRGLLGRCHDRVKNPELIIERYRGRFPDRILSSVYYAACHGPYASEYSPQIQRRTKELAFTG
jgi:hypothetical protein